MLKGGRWICIKGKLIKKFFECVVILVYVYIDWRNREILWVEKRLIRNFVSFLLLIFGGF